MYQLIFTYFLRSTIYDKFELQVSSKYLVQILSDITTNIFNNKNILIINFHHTC